MRLAYLFLFSFIVYSCTKNETKRPTNASFVGGWAPVNPAIEDGYLLSFSETGQVVYKKWGERIAIPYSTFQISSDSTMIFSDAASTIHKEVKFFISGNTLRLSGACINACDETFGKILAID